MKRTASQAYADRFAAIHLLIVEIQDGLEDHRAAAEDEPDNWGSVGDLTHYQERLREVADSLLHRGEFAR